MTDVEAWVGVCGDSYTFCILCYFVDLPLSYLCERALFKVYSPPHKPLAHKDSLMTKERLYYNPGSCSSALAHQWVWNKFTGSTVTVCLYTEEIGL